MVMMLKLVSKLECIQVFCWISEKLMMLFPRWGLEAGFICMISSAAVCDYAVVDNTGSEDLAFGGVLW
jgi:hypothetical protein